MASRGASQCGTLPCLKVTYARWHAPRHTSCSYVVSRAIATRKFSSIPSIVRACDRESHVGQWDVIRDGGVPRLLCVIEWHSDTLLEWHLDSDVNCLRSKSVVEARRLSSSVPSPEAWRREPSPPKRANSLLIELARHGSPIPWQSELINRRTR